MLKYSIAALALVATSTFALADPNSGSAGPGGSAGGSMEHSGGGMPGGAGGAMKGDSGPAMKGSDAGSSKSVDGPGMKGDRSSSSEKGSGDMGKKAASDERPDKADRKQATDEKSGKSERNRQAEDSNRDMKNDKSGKMSDQARDNSRSDKAATGSSEGAEGKARPKGSITSISPEQKTRVRSAFVSHRVAPARDIGISVNVGVVVPRSVHFYPVPAEIVTIAPDYSGYEYFMIDESHVAIVDPDTLEVVDIIVVA